MLYNRSPTVKTAAADSIDGLNGLASMCVLAKILALVRFEARLWSADLAAHA